MIVKRTVWREEGREMDSREKFTACRIISTETFGHCNELLLILILLSLSLSHHLALSLTVPSFS